MMKAFLRGPLTGWHVLGVFVAFFGVVIAVNVVMARDALSTFGGVVVDNSYVASQHYNRWLDEAARERKLGWTARATRRKDGRVAIELTGVPAGAVEVDANAWHPLGRMPDHELRFLAEPSGVWVSEQPLPEGRWRLRIEVKASGQRWRTEEDLT